LGRVRRQLSGKTSWRGGRLVVADRFFPSSKTCSAGGMVNAKLSLAERVFRCEGCGLVIDRDVNAARNLLVLAVSGRGACGAEVRGPHEAGLVGSPVRPSVAGHTATTGGPREACFAG
jgi:putative transposase